MVFIHLNPHQPGGECSESTGAGASVKPGGCQRFEWLLPPERHPFIMNVNPIQKLTHSESKFNSEDNDNLVHTHDLKEDTRKEEDPTRFYKKGK